MYKINKFQFNLSSDIDIYEKNLKFVSKNSTGFRFWYYFRTGYATYFAFILAAINTLTVTYFLAIERFPALQSVFPTFGQYVLIITLIGIPLLTGIGFVHYKRTKAFKSEADVLVESNPYQGRNIVNITIILNLTLRLNEMMIKQLKDQKLTKEELEDLSQLQKEIKSFLSDRTFYNKKDLEYLKKNITI